MKDGRTHLAHKAEHAVDLDTRAIAGMTDGDTTTSVETLIEAAEQVEAVRPDGEGIKEVVGDERATRCTAIVGAFAVRGRRLLRLRGERLE
jgi:hypothetical protein